PLLQLVLEQLFDGRCAEAHAFRAHHHVELVVQHIRMLLEVDDERAKDALQVAPELFPISLTLHEEADEFARVPAQRLGVSHGGDDGGEEVRGLVPRQLSQRTTSNLEHRGVPPQSAAPRGEPYSLRSRPWISWSLSSIERHTPASWSHHGSSETKEAEVFTSKRRHSRRASADVMLTSATTPPSSPKNASACRLISSATSRMASGAMAISLKCK